MIPFLSLFGSVEGNCPSPFARDCSAMDLRDEIVTFVKTPKCVPRDQDPGLGAASESVDEELTDDDGEDKGEGKVSANSLSSDTEINDHIASVIMVDEGEHDDVSTMDNIVCANEDISIGGSSSPSSFS